MPETLQNRGIEVGMPRDGVEYLHINWSDATQVSSEDIFRAQVEQHKQGLLPQQTLTDQRRRIVELEQQLAARDPMHDLLHVLGTKNDETEVTATAGAWLFHDIATWPCDDEQAVELCLSKLAREAGYMPHAATTRIQHAWRAVEQFLNAVSAVDGWRQSPKMRALGDHLVRQLRQAVAEEKLNVPASAFQAKLQERDYRNDPVAYSPTGRAYVTNRSETRSGPNSRQERSREYQSDERPAVVAVPPILQRERPHPNHPPIYHALRRGDQDTRHVQTDVPVVDTRTRATADAAREVQSGAEATSQHRGDPARQTGDVGTDTGHNVPPATQGERGGVHRLSDRGEVRRGDEVAAQQLPARQQQPDHSRLARRQQDQPTQPIPTAVLHSAGPKRRRKRRLHGANAAYHRCPSQPRTAGGETALDHRAARSTWSDSPQPEERRHARTDLLGSRRKGRPADDFTPREASSRHQPNSELDREVRSNEPCHASAGARDRKSNQTSVNALRPGYDVQPRPHRDDPMHVLIRRRDKSLNTDDTAWPLHVAPITTVNITRLEEMTRPEWREAALKAWSFCSDARLYDNATNGRPIQSPKHSTQLTLQQIEQLIQSGCWRKLAKNEQPSREASIFLRKEHEGTPKQRRRVILWPEQLNAELEQQYGILPSPGLIDVVHHAQQSRQGDWAVTFDMEKSFLQIPLTVEVQRYFAVRVKGSWIVPTRLPMGVIFAVPAAQWICRVLADNPFQVTTGIHVDNIRFVGSRVKIQRAANLLRERAQEANVVLNEEPCNHPHQHGDWEHETGEVSLADKTITKLLREKERVLAAPDATVEDLRVAYGLLFYASRVLRLPVAQYYVAIKFFRRRMAAYYKSGDLDAPANVWDCARPVLDLWFGDAMQNVPVQHAAERTTGRSITIITDASTTGWGGICCDNAGKIVTAAGRWATPKTHTQINELETAAITHVIHTSADFVAGAARLLLLVDNTATMHAMHKGSAAAYQLNKAVRGAMAEITRHCTGDVNVTIGYITSEDNPSEALSRTPGAPERQASELVALVERGVARAKHLRVALPRSTVLHLG